MRRRIEKRFASRPESVGAARRSVAAAWNDWGIDEGDAESAILPTVLLIVSELATNAIEATAEEFQVTVTASAQYVEIAVEDDNPMPAELIRARPDQVGGRGLALVADLSASWGQEAHDGHRKKVWARVALP